MAILLGELSRLTRTVLPLVLALYFFGAALLAIFFVESRAILVADAPGLADGVAFLDALPLALVSPARRLRLGQALGPWPAVVAASAGVALPSPILRGRADEAPSPTARLMTVDVNIGIESFPRVRLCETWLGRRGPGAHAVREIHRRERFTPGTLSSPDVREIRWFLHLRYARDVPGKAPIQRSSANGRAISAGTSNAS